MIRKIKYFHLGMVFCFLIIVGRTGQFTAQNKNSDSLSFLHPSGDSKMYDTTHINSLNAIAIRLMYSNPDSAIILSTQALNLAQRLFKTEKKYSSLWKMRESCIAKSYNYLGGFNWLKGNYSLSLDYYSKALSIRESLKDKKGISEVLGHIGIVYFEQGKYPSALDYYFKALKIIEELGDKQLQANTLNNIGNLYLKGLNDFPKSLNYYFETFKIAEELGNRSLEATALGNIGLVYYIQHDYSQALNFYFKVLKMDEAINNKNAIASHLGNIGLVYHEQAKIAKQQRSFIESNSLYNKALSYYFKELKIVQELGGKNFQNITLGNIGTIYLEQKKYRKAEEYLQKALAFSTKINALSIVANNQKSLSELYGQTHQTTKAFEFYKKYIITRDSIGNEETFKKTLRSEVNFDFEKKEAVANAVHKSELEKQSAVAKAESHKQIVITWSTACGLLLVLIFSIFISHSLRVTRKQKGLIEIQKNEVSKQKEEADSQRIIAESLREVSEKQKEIVEEKQKEIIQSITYAKRIQTALLTSDNYIKEHLPAEHFVLFKPKDIVSGDFYWAISTPPLPGWDMGTNKIKLPSDTKRKNTFYMMTADCTGHGVPGAFMSMLNISYLHENIVERGVRLPHDILNSQRKEIIQALNPVGSTEESKDGMDCTLCVYDFDKMLLHFAAANNPLYFIRNGELAEYKADKMPVGKYNETMAPFSLQTITLQKGDIVYTSTDGFADQFGVNGKKLMKKKFKEELLKIHLLPMDEQKEYLNNFFENWKGRNEQVDDVCVIGVRI